MQRGRYLVKGGHPWVEKSRRMAGREMMAVRKKRNKLVAATRRLRGDSHGGK